ncbi:MAG: cytochrome c [Hyphomicrobiales bacterium]|nr:cytochrome c [Hyphomicrobiales bacterium]
MKALSTYAAATLPALIVLGFFVWFANWIPQTRWDPPRLRQIDASMSPADLAALGKIIIRERGCMACHTIEAGGAIKGQGRGPNLDGIAQRRADGVPDGAKTQVEYLAEALIAPGAYLVEGFANIMPAATKAPAKLSREEVAAVVAFLQSLGGTPSATVATLPTGFENAANNTNNAGDANVTEQAATLEITEPAKLLEAFECLSCHSLNPGEVLVGPPFEAEQLRTAANTQGSSPEAYVLQSIVDPRAVQSEKFPADTMPDDYGKRLNAAQTYALVRYLLEQEKAQ